MTMARSGSVVGSSSQRRGHLLGIFFLAVFVARNPPGGGHILASAKTVSGDFKLNGAKSERIMASFAVFPEGGRLKVVLSSKQPYPNEAHLKIRLYRDVEWASYTRALTCREKVKVAQQSLDVKFERINSVDHRVYEATQQVLMFRDPEDSPDNPQASSGYVRPHYWYFVVDDCSLEEYFQDTAIPEIHFELNVFNHIEGSKGEVTHLSADEHHLTTIHTVTLVLSSLVVFLLFMNAVLKLSTGKATVHFAVLWVAATAALDAGSSLFELMHLQIYKSNGIGSYWVDAISSHLEALCDSFLAMLLLSIAAGWTLPSDMIPMSAPTTANSMQKLLSDMSKPIGSLRKVNAAGILGLLVVASHTILAQMGRIYNDDFESYHDFEHLPGKLIMVMRILLGVLFLTASGRTRNNCHNPKLVVFYTNLTALGLAWFVSLPVLTWVCNTFVPYYLRHPAVFITSALSQSISIVLLAWLVTAHSTAYHRLSHISKPGEQSLTDELSNATVQNEEGNGARTWKLGNKAKVRLD